MVFYTFLKISVELITKVAMEKAKPPFIEASDEWRRAT